MKSRLRFRFWSSLAVAATVLLVYVVTGRVAFLGRPAAKADTPIDDVSVPAEAILSLSPDIAKIEVLVKASRPTHRIIHIADCHYVPRETYRTMQTPPSEEGYAERTRRVENLQEAQLRLLRWLVDWHGLKEVFKEGVWKESLPHLHKSIDWAREWESKRDGVRAEATRLRRGNSLVP